MNHLLLLYIKRIRFAQTGKNEYKTLSECPIVTAAQRSSEIPIFLNTQRFGRKSLSLHATITFPSRVQKCYLNHIFKIIIHSLMETGIEIMEVLMLTSYIRINLTISLACTSGNLLRLAGVPGTHAIRKEEEGLLIKVFLTRKYIKVRIHVPTPQCFTLIFVAS